MKTIALLAALLASPAMAEPYCDTRGVIIEALAGRYGEGPVLAAIDAGGNLVEIVANVSTGTWTLIVTKPGGAACVIATGNAIEVTAPGDPA